MQVLHKQKKKKKIYTNIVCRVSDYYLVTGLKNKKNYLNKENVVITAFIFLNQLATLQGA